MTETINTIESKEMNTLIEKAKKAYAAINQQETKIGKNIYDLGETLNDLNIKANSNGVTFGSICDNYFDFSRQYGYRMIKFYKIQKKFHEEGLLANDKYLSNAMLLTLMRSKEPIEIWKKALEQTDTPTTTLINQLIGNDKNKTVDIKDMIAKANKKNIWKVLMTAKKQKYCPSLDESKVITRHLYEYWHNLPHSNIGNNKNDEKAA